MDKKIYLLLLSFFSLFLLFLASFFINPPFVPLEKISEKNIDEKIITKGIMEKVYIGENFADIRMKGSNISLIIFENEKMEFVQNSTLEVEGTVSLYKSNLEIVVDKIICLNC